MGRQGSTRERRARRVSPSTRRGRRRWRRGGARRIDTRMPRPTTTSAAATTITKNTAVWPSMSSSCTDRATNDRLAALSISSMHMNITSGLRRMSRPTAPIENSSAAEQQVPGRRGGDHGDHDASSPRRRASPSATRGRRRVDEHGAGDRDDQQHRRQLEGEHVVAEEARASCWMLASWPALVAGDVEAGPGLMSSASRARTIAATEQADEADAHRRGERTLERDRFDAEVRRPGRRRAA